jgi:hypothetical protein
MFKAHDEANEAHVGDTVRIVESRPLSATRALGGWSEVIARAASRGGEAIVAEEAATERSGFTPPPIRRRRARR